MFVKNFSIKFPEYILRYFPCTCAGYYKDKNKKDPECFSCNHYDTLFKMFKDVRYYSLIEGRMKAIASVEIGEGQVIFKGDSFKEIDYEAFWNRSKKSLFSNIKKVKHEKQGDNKDT